MPYAEVAVNVPVQRHSPAREAGPDADVRAGCEKRALRMARAGMRTVQLGVESLSTPLLRRISKGVDAARNVRGAPGSP